MSIPIDKLYVGSASASYAPTTIRGVWDESAGFPDGRVLTTVYEKAYGGPAIGAVEFESSAAADHDILSYRGISEPLETQTITGNVNVTLFMSEGSLLTNAVYHIHLYVIEGESDNVRGTLLSDYIDATELPVSSALVASALTSSQTMSSLAVTAGDRLVVEIGSRSLGTSILTRSIFFGYGTVLGATAVTRGAVAPDATAGDTPYANYSGWLSFSDGLEMLSIPAAATQVPLEVAGEGTEDLKLTQSIPEAMGEGTEDFIATQVSFEALGEGTERQILSQLTIEYLSPTANAGVKASQVVIEVLSDNATATVTSDEILSQLVIEVLSRGTSGTPVEPIYTHYDPHEYTANLSTLELIGNLDLMEFSANIGELELIGNVDLMEFSAADEENS